jgi:hypothetical protein
MFDPYTFLNVTIPHAAFIDVTQRIELLAAGKDKREDPECVALTGPSGAGKTFTLDALYRRNSSYETPEGTIRPWIKVTVPSHPTTKNLAAEILTALDPGDSCRSSTESQLTKRITKLLEECQTDVIWLDEFQHLYDRKNEDFYFEAANWLKRLIEIEKPNKTKRMLIISGLEDSLHVIQHNSQLRRRFSARLSLPCFSWTDAQQRREFSACLVGFLDRMKGHFTLHSADTATFVFRFYCATGGLIGYVKRLLRETVLYAHANETYSLDLADFDQAFNRYLCSSPELQRVTYRPFSREFTPIPTEELLAIASLIGTPPHRPPASKMREKTLPPPGKSFVAAGLAGIGSA